MREIKFRAWDNKQKSMSASFTLSDMHEATYMNLEPKNHIDNYKIMQYTGLKDKNGKEIYEGDQLKINNKWQGVVKYGIANAFDGCCSYVKLCGFYIERKDSHSIMFNYEGQHLNPEEEYEVIGNIYENPELLKNNNE